MIGENHRGIKAAYQHAMGQNLCDAVKKRFGSKEKAYAATNENEYFAEFL